MNEFSTSNSSESAPRDEPQFGLLEVIEAFTAMRHEWRTQSRESRELADSVQSATEWLKRIEATIDQKISYSAEEDLTGIVQLVIDLDIRLDRAVQALEDCIQTGPQREQLVDRIQHRFRQSGFWTRWFGKKFCEQVISEIQSTPDPIEPLAEGFRLVHHRLRQSMSERKLMRVDPTGQPFDAETMKAVSSVPSDAVPAGHVAETLTPLYLHRGRVAGLAEVRVAR